MPNETLAPKTPILSSKTLEKFSKTCGPELGHFEPLTSHRVLGRGRRHRPPTLHTRQPGRCATSERSRRPNFTANHRRTRPDRTGEAAAATTVGHRTFLDFFGHFRPFPANPYLISTIFGPSELILVVPFCRFLTV